MKTILFIVEDKKAPQYRYRVQNIIEALKDSKKLEAKYCLTSEVLTDETRLDGMDFLVLLRQTAKNRKLLKLIKKNKKNKVVLFDLDDLVFDYRDLPLVMWTTKGKNIFFWVGYFWGVRRIAKRVDGFVVTNEFLGEKIKRSFKKPCIVIPNSLNETQVGIADKCVNEKKEKNSDTRTKKFRIGYFSGSPTHERDLQMVEPELIKFLQKHDDVILEVVGYMKYSNQLRELIKQKKVRIKPLVGYRELEREMAEVEVNIAPLVINDFTNCKSELKFFEAAVVETTTIASPSYTFEKCITDGENGFLTRPGEWFEKLEYLYQNPKKNREIAKRARRYAMEHYYGKEFLRQVEEAYDYFLSD